MHEGFLAACRSVLSHNKGRARSETRQPSWSILACCSRDCSCEQCWPRHLNLSKATWRALNRSTPWCQSVAQRTHSARVQEGPLLSCQKTQQTRRIVHLQRPRLLSHTCKFRSRMVDLGVLASKTKYCALEIAHSQTHPEYRSDLSGCSRYGRAITLSAAAASE